MGLFPISFFSHLRGLIGRPSSSRRFYALARQTNPIIPYSDSEQVEKEEGKFDWKELESNQISVQRIVTKLGFGRKLDSFFVELIRKGDNFSVSDLLAAIVDDSLRQRISSALVKAYTHLEMFEQAINIFFYSRRRLECGPDAKSLNFLLHRMIASREYDMVVSSLLQLGKLGFDADAYTCTLLVRAFCNERRIDDAETLVRLMEGRGIVQNMCVYSAIVEGHRKKMDFLKAVKFFFDQVYYKKGRVINCSIASSVLQCCCQKGMFLEAYHMFEDFRDKKNVLLDRVCYNVAFDALGKLGHVEEAIDLFREMTGKGIVPDVINYTTLIGGCYRGGEIGKARDLMIEMEGRCKTPDGFAYSVLADGLARNGFAMEARKTLDEMEDRGVKPTSFTHSMVIEGLFVAGKIDEAEALYKSLEHKSQEVDASMVRGYCETGCLDKAFKLFARLEFSLHKNVYHTLFTSLCVEDDHVEKAQYVMDRMSKLGVEPGKSMFGMLIGAWCRVNNVRKARQNFKVLLSFRRIIPDLITYTKMINAYCRLNELKEADFFFRDMKQRGIVPDVVTYTVFVNHYPELELNMKREMKALGVKRDVYYYTVLIVRQCKIGDIEEAERIFDEMIENGVEPDVVPYTALIVGWCVNGNVHKAVPLMEEMEEKGLELTKASKDLVAYTVSKARRLRK